MKTYQNKTSEAESMLYETSSNPAYDNLRDTVVSLGMEISDPLLSSLTDAIADCRLENESRSVSVAPILIGIETVGEHINSVRALSDPRAFDLLQDLLDTYKKVTDNPSDDYTSQETAASALHKVLEWQHNCILQVKDGSITEPSLTKRINSQDILKTVQSEIAKTLTLVNEETAIIRDAIHQRKETTSYNSSSNLESMLISHIDILQQTFQEELNKLRKDLQPTISTK